MKNATKHADDLKTFSRRLIKEYKAPPRQSMDALPALVRAAMSYDVSDVRADDAIKAIEREFVDLNELRVATDLEIHDLLGVRYPAIERRVAMITQSLNAIFEKEHTLSLDRLKTISKRDARQFLRELPDSHPFVEAYIMLFSFDGHTFPIDSEMLAFLVEKGVFEPRITLEDSQKFIEHHLKADELYDFYFAMRQASADDSMRKKKK